MKNIVKLLIFISFILIEVCSCGYDHGNYRNHKADDLLSKTVYAAVEDDIYYISRIEKDNTKYYKYMIHEEEKEVITAFITALNQAVSDNQVKVEIELCSPIPGGAEYNIFFRNFSDSKCENADYDGFKNIQVNYPEVTESAFFSNPTTYTVLPDIRVLEIDEKLHDKAVEQGIDWYQIWPDLEKLEVFD